MKKAILPLCILSVLCCSMANASSISGPFTTTTPIPLTKTDWVVGQTLAFPQFNPALGTLLSVEIKIDGTVNSVLTISNDSESPSSGNCLTQVTFTVQDSGGNLDANVPDIYTSKYNYLLDGGQSTTSGLITGTGSHTKTYTNPAVLAEFTGSGSTLLNVTTFTQTLLANTGGNTAASQVTQASVTGTVTYNYEVPEPATIGLLISGLLGFVRRGFRK